MIYPDRLLQIFCCNLVSYWQYRAESSGWPSFNTSQWTIPFQSHHTHSIILLAVNPGFEVLCDVSLTFFHDRLHFTFSYFIHFSSPITICLRNESISLRFNNFSLMKFRSINFFVLIRVTLKHRAFFCSQHFLNDSKLFSNQCSVPKGCLQCLHAGASLPFAEFTRLFQWLVGQSMVHLSHRNFQNEIVQIKVVLYVPLEHLYRKLHKVSDQILQQFCIFLSKKT